MTLVHFESVVIYLCRLHLTGCLDTAGIQMISSSRCLRYLHVDWSGVLLTDDIKCVILLLVKGHVSVWRDSDLNNMTNTRLISYPGLLIML